MTFRPMAQFCGLMISIGSVSTVAAQDAGIAVVEVFTSEGCSSCPPAEEMLHRLDQQNFGHGQPVISLEWHVDYWDYLGWKDRFGSAQATKRQYQYARTLPSQVYTPQAVINGTFVPDYAGDLGEVKTLVQQVLGQPSAARIDLSVVPTGDADVVQLQVNTHGDTSGAKVLGLLVEDGLASKPNAGENSGRDLRHTHVVRKSQLFDQTGDLTFAIGHEFDRANSSIVVLLQDPKSLRILAANRVKLASRVSFSQGSQWNGRVVDRRGNPQAKVSLQACSPNLCIPGTTDENGSFVFPSLPDGRYSLTVGTSRDVVEVTLSGQTIRTPVVVP